MKNNRKMLSFALIACILLAATVTTAVRSSAQADQVPSVKIERFLYQEVVEQTAAAHAANDGDTRVDKTLVGFETYVGTVERPREFTSATSNELKWQPGQAGEPVAALGAWYIRSSGHNRQAIVKFTAKYPVRVTLSNSAITGTWAKNSYFDSYVERDEKLTLIDSKHVSTVGTANGDNVDIAAGTLDTTAHLNAGDSFFYAYRSAGGMQELQNPCDFLFTFDYENFDASYTPTELVRSGDDAADWATLVSDLVARGGKTYKGNALDVDLFAGKIGSSGRFDTVVSDGLGAGEDAISYGGWQDGIFNETSGRLVRWEARGNAVLKFTAKANVALSLDFSGIHTWSSLMTCSVYAESGADRLSLLTMAVTAKNADSAQSVTRTVQLKTGDAAYFCITGSDLINIAGSFAASQDKYIEADRPPYKKAAELIAYAAAKDDSDYTAAGRSAIDDIVAKTIARLDADSDFDALIAAAKADIDAVAMGKDFKDIAAELIAVPNHAEAENAFVKYAAGVGTPEEFEPFALVGGDVLKNETVSGEPEHNNHINPEQLRATGSAGTVLQFTAKANTQLRLDFTAKTTWAYSTRFMLYAKSGDALIPIYTGTFPETSGTQTVNMRASVHAAAGDAVYLVVTTGGNRNTVEFSGDVTEGVYDAEKRPDYARAAQITALAVQSDYSAQNWEIVNGIVVDKIISLFTAADGDAVVNAARTAIGTVAMGRDYASFVADIAGNKDFAPEIYTAAEMGLYAGGNIRSGDLRSMVGIKNETLYYTTSDKAPTDINTDTDCAVSMSPFQIISHDKMSAVVSIKAKKNLKITVTTPQLGDNYAWVAEDDKGNLVTLTDVIYYLTDNGKTYKVKSAKVVKTGGDYGYTAHVKAGETLYYTVYSAGWATVDLVPTFAFTDDYDENWMFDAIKDPSETFVWQDMVSAQMLAGGDMQSNDLLDWQFVYGETLDSLERFDVYAGSKESDHALYIGTSTDPSCAAWRWQWRVSNPYLTVLKFSANENVYLEMKHGAIKLADYVPGAYVKTVVENDEGIRITRKTYVPKVNNQADAYFSSEHLAKGDTLYLILEPIVRDAGSFPHTLAMTSTESETLFKADTAAYDADLRANYDFEKEMIAYRAAKSDEIRAYAATLDEQAYSTVNWLLINEYADGLASTVAGMDDKEKIDAAFALAKERIDAVPTAAAEKAELDAYKAQKKSELAAYVKESDYTAENWSKISEYIETANASIDAAKTMTAVRAAESAARNRIDRIEKITAAKGCGCGSATVGGAVLFAEIAMTAALLVLFKRKIKGA